MEGQSGNFWVLCEKEGKISFLQISKEAQVLINELESELDFLLKE